MVSCTLCGLPTAHPLEGENGSIFCCPSCREVSALLEDKQATGSKAPDLADRGEMSEATLSLSGLWCSSCAWLIGERLRRAQGVGDADVSFLQREARVTFDPQQTGPRRLARQVRRLGYRAWLPDEEPYDEEDAHQTRLLIAGVLVMHVMVISFMFYIRDWLGLSSADTRWLVDFFQIILLVASLPVVLILGIPILRAGLASLLRGRPNTHTLIALGSFSAFALSVRNLLAGLDVYFDTAAVLLFLVSIGHWLEIRAQKASSQAVERLQGQLPAEATWMREDGEREVPAEQVPVGGRVRVRPGQRFPVDGLVAAGQGDVDESLLTGEPDPVRRSAGEQVLAGTINLDGSFEVITTAAGSETVAGQIGRLLHQALWQRAPVQRLADRVAALMVPAAVLLAAGTFAFWSYRVGTEAGLIYALSVLLIACPCALGIATPLTLWIGLERAAASGVILRNTGVLERLDGVEHLFFDKTGTLTQRPLRLQMVASDGVEEDVFLARVGSLEAQSEHPLAQAIYSGAQVLEGGEPLTGRVSHFRALPGSGVTGSVDGMTLWVGSRRLMAERELALSDNLAETAEAWQKRGVRVVFAGWEGRVTGLLGLGESPRPEAAEAIGRAQTLGLDVAVLTGDGVVAGARWQQLLGVPVQAGLRPDEKVERIRRASQTMMVGDGINDGPALAAAGVGLAISQGTEVAQAAADAVLLHDDLLTVPWLVSLARQAMRKVRQNLAWAFVYNVIGLALAVTGHLQPVLAALAMVASSALVTGNALRLRHLRLGEWGDPRGAVGESSPTSLRRAPAAQALTSGGD